MNNKNQRILITGGHLTPAMAVLHELKKRGYNNIVWVGHKYNQAKNKQLSPEFITVTSNNITFIELKTGKLVRKWTKETFVYGIAQFIYIITGFLKSLFIILKYRPRIIISFGGYLALPVVFWGKLLGSKIVTHEQTIVTGLANKLISKFANKIFISWENSKHFFNPKKTILTGNPVRREIFISKSESLTKGFNKKLPTIYITGGNQGANEINKRVFAVLEKILEDCNVIHQTGNSSVTQDFEKSQELKAKLPYHLKERYVVKDFILENEIGEAMQNADLLLCRAGANTVSEILALGKLAILMPIPWVSFNEQQRNAEMVVNTGLGHILIQKDTLSSETVFQTILFGLTQLKRNKGFNNDDIEKCKEKARLLVNLDAPMIIVDEIEKALL